MAFEPPATANSDQLLTTDEAADVLRISPTTLKYWRRMRRGPVYQLVGSRRIRYRRADLINFLTEQSPSDR